MDQQETAPQEQQEVDAKLSFKSLKTILNKAEQRQQQQQKYPPANPHPMKNHPPSHLQLDLYYKSSKGAKRCLILNYDTFTSTQFNSQNHLPKSRSAWSSTDVHLLEVTLSQLPNFTSVSVHHNLTYSQTIRLLRDEARDPANRDNFDLFLVIILSSELRPAPPAVFGHRHKLAFHTADRPIEMELIVDQITRPSATLAGRPKVFLLECSSVVDAQREKKPAKLLVADAAAASGTSGRQCIIPRYADLLIAYMTSNVLAPEKLARSSSKPISLLAHHLRHNSVDCHLMGLLTMLAADLQNENKEAQNDNQTPPNSSDHLLQVMSTLTGLVSLTN